MVDIFPLFRNLHVRCRLCNELAVAFAIDSHHALARNANYFLCEQHLAALLRENPALQRSFLENLRDSRQRALSRKLERRLPRFSAEQRKKTA